MSWKCLLCGYGGESQGASKDLPCCSWCEEESRTLHAEEISALIKLSQIEPAFRVWRRGRREDSEGEEARNDVPVPQPARIFAGMRLYVGDMDDAADVTRLYDLGIGFVVNLCGLRAEYANVPANLAMAGINQQILVAQDSRDCNIIEVAEYAMGAIHTALASTNLGVLVHCWGGVNRSAAVAAVYLTTQCGVPLFAAVERMMKQRGTVLTNQSFCKQLVRHCFKHGLNLEGSTLPDSFMLAASTCEDGAKSPSCTDTSGRKHRQDGQKDNQKYGLLNASRDGCFECVKHYIEQDGVDPNSESDTKKYTARGWAEWRLKRTKCRMKRFRYYSILTYLGQYEKAAARSDQASQSG